MLKEKYSFIFANTKSWWVRNVHCIVNWCSTAVQMYTPTVIHVLVIVTNHVLLQMLCV